MRRNKGEKRPNNKQNSQVYVKHRIKNPVNLETEA
jgi:hypothetical protein